MTVTREATVISGERQRFKCPLAAKISVRRNHFMKALDQTISRGLLLWFILIHQVTCLSDTNNDENRC